MSLAALAAAATVFDTVEDVARDIKMSIGATRAHLQSSGIASVSNDGKISMSIDQSMIAADAIDNAERGW